MTADALETVARRVRGGLLTMTSKAQSAHTASSLSCVDILVAAYFDVLKIDPKLPADPDRDRFIFSKGHAISALYATLAERGFFSRDLLRTFNDDGGSLPEQPSPGCVPGLEAATGSLGHGLPIGVGMALAARIKKQSYGVYVLMSDGECNEGSVWEAALLAPAQKLENLVAIIDFNKWQATGRSREVMSLDPFVDKWTAFGWNALGVDGHDLKALAVALRTRAPGRPTAIIADTIKGKGVSFMEDDNNWHYRAPNPEELAKAKKELGL